MTPRTIFIWDVHGCIEELRELMDKLAPTREDRVIFLGNLINKGPDSVGVVQYVYKHGYECVLGNHELSYARYHTEKPKYREHYSRVSPEIHDWLLNLPHYIEGDDFIAVHGGVAPGLHPRNTDRGIVCEIRYWNTEDSCIGNKDHIPWHELYTGTKKVIYGHWAVQRLMVQDRTIGLDSACVYGGELSAYILETAEIVQVQAKQIYQPIK